MRRVLTILFGSVVLSTPLGAQLRVTVEIRASIPAEGGRRVPVIGRFWLISGPDSLAIMTNGQGVGRAEVQPGRYRLRSYQRVGIGALDYYWDVPVRIVRGTAVDLTEQNSRPDPPTGAVNAAVMDDADSTAAAITELPLHTPASVQATLAAPPLPYRQAGDPGYRDPVVARVLGFVIPGAGHLYAGEPAKGVGLLAVGGLGAAFLLSQLPCGGDREPCDTPMVGFGALAYLASAIYSIVDAAPAARRANVIRPEFALVPLPQGRLGAGARFPLP